MGCPAYPGVYLQSGINTTRTTAVGGITSDIFKEALFLATRADIRRSFGLYGVAALAAFPVGFGGVGRTGRIVLAHGLLLW